MHTQNLPVGSNIKISCVCIYLAETYTAVYVAYELLSYCIIDGTI